MYAGADSGIYRSEDRGASWERLDSPMNTLPIWALAIDPVDQHHICRDQAIGAFSLPGWRRHMAKAGCGIGGGVPECDDPG